MKKFILESFLFAWDFQQKHIEQDQRIFVQDLNRHTRWTHII